jgi:hypothetical protein
MAWNEHASLETALLNSVMYTPNLKTIGQQGPLERSEFQVGGPITR